MVSKAVLLFGATGDLARRMLLPSLFALHDDGLLGQDIEILATSRSELDDAGYRAMAEKAVREHLSESERTADNLPGFLERISYQSLDIQGGQAGFDQLAARLGGGAGELAIFLSTAPSLFEPTIAGLKAAGLAHDKARIGLEKPLGTDLASSCEINDAVAAAFPEQRIFRIDHYLGKETVQNLLALRFANVLFEPLWNARHIDHVQISVAETVGLEGRADYYDGVGALRDMVQNHVLQLLALVAMEPPSRFDSTAVRDEKVKVLRSLRPVTCDDGVTGQYRGYDGELKRDSATETFVALKAQVDNWRWAGVPFYLRTGKRLAERRTEIVVQFKAVPHSIFSERGATAIPNRLIIAIQPQENIHLSVMAKEPGLDRGGIKLREVPLDISMPDAFAGPRRRIAYERLLLDLIEGDQTLFVRRDEVEAEWQWIDQVRACWAEQGAVPEYYDAGSKGPDSAAALIARDGRAWHD
nr:glucose-6-phosphate dehydrogenase [Sphingomonas mesophila]